MTLELERSETMRRLVDAEKGLVDRKIFSDPEIYQLELERIFARAWNFMAHDSQIPNPGDFFLTFIGEDRVIVVRDKEGQAQVLINSCRHRGNAVCRAEEGHATSFMCTYHGWTYDLKGALVGVPGFKEVYHEDINREEWGLIRAAHVDTYKGFIFATLDEAAPSLTEFLGEVGRLSIDFMAERGDMSVVPGIQKYTIGCNWKLAADNVWDYYHPAISHASSNMARWNRQAPNRNQAPATPTTQPQAQTLNQNVRDRFAQKHIVMAGDYGHAISGPMHDPNSPLGEGNYIDQTWRQKPDVRERMGPIVDKIGGHPHIFPNMWFTSSQVSMRMPKGPTTTEIWWFSFVNKEAAEDEQARRVHSSIHVFGPAGMLEQDDGENWDQSTRGTMGTVIRRYPLNYAMNLGRGEIIEDEIGTPRIETHVNEHAQLWLYRGWSEWMAAESWDDLKANHSRSPKGFL